MIPENEGTVTSTEKPFELIEKVVSLPTIKLEMVEMNPIDEIRQTIVSDEDNYDESLRNFVEKYSKK